MAYKAYICSMRFIHYYSLLLLSILCMSSCDPVRELPIILTNPLDTSWENAQILIPRKFLEKRLGTVEPENRLIVRKGGQQIPSQMDDLDMDGKWDELALVMNFESRESIEVEIAVRPTAERESYPPSTHLHLGKNRGGTYETISSADRLSSTDTEAALAAFQFEGPGWENEMVGFRNYLDSRNGIDIFGKLTEEMVLEQVGATLRYDSLQNWGMDILKVGNSLGAGAIALQKNDQLYRVSAEKSHATLLASGPVRAILELSFSGMQVEETVYALTHQIQIWKGQPGYTAKVKIAPYVNDVYLVAGIVNMDSTSLHLGATEQAIYGYTHAPQTINREMLGMGILTAEPDFKTTLTTKDEGEGIIQTHGMVLFLKEEEATSYHFLTAWEKRDSLFAEQEVFHTLLKKEAEKVNTLIEVNWK